MFLPRSLFNEVMADLMTRSIARDLRRRLRKLSGGGQQLPGALARQRVSLEAEKRAAEARARCNVLNRYYRHRCR